MLSILEACIFVCWWASSGVRTTHTKFCSVDTIGLPSTKTLMIFPCLVTIAKERVSKRQKFPLNPIMVIELFDV